MVNTPVNFFPLHERRIIPTGLKRTFRLVVLGSLTAVALTPWHIALAQPGTEEELTPPPMQVTDPIPTPPPPTPPAPPLQAPLPPVDPAPPATPALRPGAMTYATPSGASTGAPMVAIGRPVERMNFGDAGNRAASQLRSMPPETFTFDRAMLRDVLRVLAEQAGIPYIGIPEHSTKAQRLITFKMTASPFAALEAACRQNDIKLTFDDGVWFMRAHDVNFERARAVEDANELVGVIYQLKHDPVDRVDFRADASGSAGGGGNTASTGVGSLSGTGGASITTPNLPLQNSQRVFEAKSPRIVNEIRVMLGLKPLEYDDQGNLLDPDVAAGTEARMGRIPPFDGEVPATTGAGEDPQAALFPVYVPAQKPQVIYNSDTNILWVVATRRQHKWIGEYLGRVDRPQDLIAIEVKFFETKKNPQTDFGINWENTFGTGITVRGSANAGTDGRFSAGQISGGGTVTGSGTTTTYSAVLGVEEVSATIQAFMRDRNSSLVQYPRVLTINNREVAITAAENTPVNAGVTQTQSGSTATQTGTLAYLPVGTQINILPKTVGTDQIAMTVAITVSSIIGELNIDLGTGANPYPITSQRVYNATLQVNSGYTLAVGGLEKVDDTETQGGIPLLKDIPVAGYLFKNKGKNRNRTNLIIFITPYTISDPSRTPGISENPESILPIRPGVPPPAPNFAPDGQLLGGSSALPGAFNWLEYQLRYFREINAEARVDRKTMDQLRSVIARARSLADHLQAQVGVGAGFAPADVVDDSARADSLLVEFNRLLAASQKNLM